MHRIPRRLLVAIVVVLLGAGVAPVAARRLADRPARADRDLAAGSTATSERDEPKARPVTGGKATGAKGGAAPAKKGPVPTDYIAMAPKLSQPRFATTRDSLDVEMEDGTQLYVEVVRPKDPGRYPVILEAAPYHGTVADRDGTRMFPDPVDAEGKPIGLTGYFAPRGYAVVMVDLRGTGRSGGCLDHLGPNDASDLKAIVEWAASQPWSNGRVGMTGHSYVGSTPSVAAAMKPKGLVTIVPSAGLASMYDHQFNKGVPWNLQWAGPQWSYETLALNRHLPPGTPNPATGGTTGDDFGEDMETFGCGAPQSAFTAGDGQVTGQYKEWHAERDWSDEVAAANIPIFMIHGVHDNAARIPAAEWFFGRRFGRPGDKVWIGQWDHGSTNGRCGGTDGARVAHPTCRFEQMQYAIHAWFDKHLMQRKVDTGPAVEVFLNGRKPVDVTSVVDPETLGALAFARDSWALPTTSLSLYPDAAAGALSFVPPKEEGTGTFGAVADALLAGVGATELELVSEPLPKDVVLLGLPKMRLDVSMSHGQLADVVTTLWREDAAGARQQVSFCGINPLVREGIETVTPVTPGEVMALDLQCFTAAQWLPKGNKLVLTVGTRSPHHASLGSDASMTLHTGPKSSKYVLPTVTDAKVVPDVRLRSASTAAPKVPLGPAQPPAKGSVVLGPPATEAFFEFDIKDGFDNARLAGTVTDIEGDVDVYLDRQGPDGAWTEVTSGANGFDVGAPETLEAGRLPAGKYRVRIANFASVPGPVDVLIEFANQAGDVGK